MSQLSRIFSAAAIARGFSLQYSGQVRSEEQQEFTSRGINLATPELFLAWRSPLVM